MNKLFKIILISFFCFSCSKDISKDNKINQKALDLQVLEAYEKGMQYLEEGDAIYAAKKFNEAEILVQNFLNKK